MKTNTDGTKNHMQMMLKHHTKQVEHNVDPLHKQTDRQTDEADCIEPALSPLLIPGLLYLKPDT